MLRGVSLWLSGPGEVVCLMGHATASARRRCSRLECAQHGPAAGAETGHCIRFGADGRDLTRRSPDVRARAGIGYVPQGRDIFPHLTVLENLKVGLLINPARARRWVEQALEMFPALKPLLQRKGGVLSGGQQQQLAIARALGADPQLLILDEPTEGIQPSVISLIGRVLVAL